MELNKSTYLALLFFLVVGQLGAQTKKIQISGGYESYLAAYEKDSKLYSFDNQKYGANNYLKLDATYKKFTIGTQLEAYNPARVGFSKQLDKVKLIQGYAKYSTLKFEITLGNFYEQFGSGLAFRSYEDRQLGFNNSIFGAKINYQPINSITIKTFSGKPRTWFDYSKTLISGIDTELGLDNLITKDANYSLILGVGYVNHLYKKVTDFDYPLHVNTISGRVNFEKGIFGISTEYVNKSKAQVFTPESGYDSKRGSAFLLNTSLNISGFGANVSLRRLEFMPSRAENTITDEPVYTNYIPALTRQHKYALANLTPYNVQSNSEIGGQADIYFEPQKSILGGGYPEKFSVNFSMYYSLKSNKNGHYSFLGLGNKMLFNDINLEIEKRWNKKLKSTIMLMKVRADVTIIESAGSEASDWYIITTDNILQFAPKKSLRAEIQHLWTNSEDKNWIYGAFEFGLAPKWLFFLKDMYNYGNSNPVHYYGIGASFSKGIFRTALSYGRNRAGYHCSGGVCRYLPASKGLFLEFAIAF